MLGNCNGEVYQALNRGQALYCALYKPHPIQTIIVGSVSSGAQSEKQNHYK